MTGAPSRPELAPAITMSMKSLAATFRLSSRSRGLVPSVTIEFDMSSTSEISTLETRSSAVLTAGASSLSMSRSFMKTVGME